MLAELGKIRITVMVAFTTATGYILAEGSSVVQLLMTVLGVFMLACGSSAMNHYQEKDLDILMDRTKYRPIPSGRITPSAVLTLTIGMWLAGSVIIILSSNLTALILGFLAVIWYNVIYTPMKRKTALAVLPGALIGSIPPAIGWSAAGGSITDPGIISLALFFFIWQIPHFWLLLLLFEKDYRRAGIPTLTSYISPDMISRMTFLWLVSLAVSGLLFFTSGLIRTPYAFLLILILGAYMIWNSRSLFSPGRMSYRSVFKQVNIYVMLIIIILSVNRYF